MNFVEEHDILFDLDANSQEEVLRMLANKAYERGKVDSADVFFRELCKREEESTTGFGNGIAIPHARHTCVKEAGILFARVNKDIDWNSIDGEPVRAMVCLIAPDDANDFHLKTLSKFARRLMYEEFVETLKVADKSTVLCEINNVIQS